MKQFLPVLLLILASCRHSYYIVRHAEKESQATGTAMMANDPPLTVAGKERAEALKEVLKNKKVGHIFSTNTIRTKTTAQPLADYIQLQIETYKPMPDSAFINQLWSLKKNVLIVGHSNTVDDIVNMLCGKKEIPGDLKDSEYDNLFTVKKKGSHYIFSVKHYGVPTQ